MKILREASLIYNVRITHKQCQFKNMYSNSDIHVQISDIHVKKIRLKMGILSCV